MREGAVLERAGRAGGFVLFTVPAVALANLAVSGALPPSRLLLGVALAAVLAAVLVPSHTQLGLLAAQLLGHLVIFVSLGEPARGCLPVMGRGAELGLRLAVLRDSTTCAPGQYAIGAVPATALTLILLAASVLLAQILGAGIGAVLLDAAGQLRTVGAAVVQVFTLLLIQPVPVPSHLRRPRASGGPATLVSRLIHDADPLRGPPALALG